MGDGDMRVTAEKLQACRMQRHTAALAAQFDGSCDDDGPT